VAGAVTSLGHVLVVDDDSALRETFRAILEVLGYEASTAASGEQAIADMATIRPDLVLLDLMMPGISGLEALTHFRQHHRTVPVIVITGNPDPEIAREARAGGAVDVLGKPIDFTAMRSVVGWAMGLAAGRAPFEPLAGIRLVIAEGHDDTRDVLEQVLRRLGATVTAVALAREALGMVTEADIIVTDLAMAEEDGVWLLEQVNQHPRPIPVIAVSGSAEGQVPRLAQAPFARKLLKPVDPWALADVIAEVLHGRPQ
jgi:CheY-like chemotaxis protein